MKSIHWALMAGVVLLFAGVCVAGLRGPGKQGGVVIFDRWGGCTLYSCAYVSYVDPAVAEKLKPMAGQFVVVDATKVEQKRNPGDAVIQAFTLPDVMSEEEEVKKAKKIEEKFKLTATADFKSGEKPVVRMELKNISGSQQSVDMSELAPTVLMALPANEKEEREWREDLERDGFHSGKYWGAHSGKSFALLTRQSFWIGDEARMHGSDWKVISPEKWSKNSWELAAGETLAITLEFSLRRGRYEFLAGYGSSTPDMECIASNLVGFDVGVGQKGTLVERTGR